MVYANLVLTGDRNTCVLQAQRTTTDVLFSVGFCSSKQELIEVWKNAVCFCYQRTAGFRGRASAYFGAYWDRASEVHFVQTTFDDVVKKLKFWRSMTVLYLVPVKDYWHMTFHFGTRSDEVHKYLDILAPFLWLQTVNLRPHAADAWVWSQVSHSGICGGRSFSEPVFKNYLVFSSLYHWASTPLYLRSSTAIRRRSGGRLGTFKRTTAVRDMQKHWAEKYCHSLGL
jgi:hypothetical protein